MDGTESGSGDRDGTFTSVRSVLMLTTAEPTKRDRAKIGTSFLALNRQAKAHDDDHAAAVALTRGHDWLPSANTYWLAESTLRDVSPTTGTASPTTGPSATRTPARIGDSEA